jgi:hypothetical protein
MSTFHPFQQLFCPIVPVKRRPSPILDALHQAVREDQNEPGVILKHNLLARCGLVRQHQGIVVPDPPGGN